MLFFPEMMQLLVEETDFTISTWKLLMKDDLHNLT
jgi:hypothetical protein